VNSRLGAVTISGAFIFAALEVASLGNDAPTGDRLARSLIDIALNGMGTEAAHTALATAGCGSSLSVPEPERAAHQLPE
jgi:hypothetical protein